MVGYDKRISEPEARTIQGEFRMSIDVLSVSHYTLSNHEDFDASLVTFESDVDIIAWRVNREGTSYDTGTVLEEDDTYWSSADDVTWQDHKDDRTWGDLAKIAAGVELTAQIFDTDLQEGSQRINIYGKNTSGTWSLYEG